MTIFQILILLFIAFVIIKATKKLIKKEISLLLYFFWVALWLAIAIINIFPAIIAWVAFSVGIGRGVDLLIYSAIIVISYTVFKINIRTKTLERNMTELVRKIALKDTNKK